MNDDVYMYTGVTSLTNDESLTGFVLINQRTKEAKYYSTSGAKETSAQSSAEGLVQQYEYEASFPLLLNIDGEPTYFMSLKDSSKLVKGYAMINVGQYSIGATGNTLTSCIENYVAELSKNALILNKPLKELCGADAPYHIVAIKRDDETLIPHGNHSLIAGDVVYFMTTPDYIDIIRDAAGKEDYPEVGHLFVMGGSSTAVHLVNHMPDHMHAKILESNATRALQLNEVVKNNHTLILHGDGRDLSLLEEEGVRKAQAFVALTQHSEQNILACLAAKRLGVRKTVAMVENTDYISMAESLDIGTIINKKTFAADHIYRMMLRADITTVKSLTVANADVAEFQTPAKALVTRRPVKDLGLPDSVTLGGLVRNGKGVLINGNTVIEPGDTVVAFCLAGGIKKLERFFK